ncbi:cell wall-active antibiotics response protein LiaF [Streptococcus timonensis]|uniref:cell wall-active antibiotics response protein LiaF n=1 Tax=Streptococcus timonensis TaxID=1852387 RepID=UPI0039C0ED61
MRKFQIFLFIEACLLTGALIMMVSEHFSRFLLMLLLILLLIRYYTGKQGNNFILVAVSILFFFIIMLNPFVILAIFVALIYSLFLLYPMMNQEREDTNLVFEEVVTVKREKNRWFGNLHHFSSYQTCRFDDINLFRLMGKDTIHLEHVILSNHDNVIILRKLVGTTRIIVPVDVEVSLSVNSLYGDLTFLDQPKRALRNEQFHQETRDYLKSPKSVKILLTTMVGDVEVVRG